jgi:hypothetical protein
VFRDAASPLTADTSAIKTLRLLKNGKEFAIASINRENLFSETTIAAPTFYGASDHVHIENTAAAYTQFATTLMHQFEDTLLLYSALNFDPHSTLENVLEFAPGDDVRFRISVTATGEIHIIPVELFPLELLAR